MLSRPATSALRLLAAAGTALLVAVAGPALDAAAVTVPLGTYSAALPVQPFPTVSGSTDPSNLGFPVTFTNTSPNGYLLSAVQVSLPTGFSPLGTPTVSASGWTASVSGNTISASTSDPLNKGVPAGSTVRLTFNATAPTTGGSYTYTTSAQGLVASTGVAGDFSNSGSDPVVDVHPYANVVTCAPDQICDTGQVGSASGTQARIVTTTGSIQDYLGLSVDNPTDASCLALLQANGRSQQMTFQDIDTARTLTLTVRVDKSIVNLIPNNGVGRLSLCYNTQNSPSHTTFVDRDGKTTTVGFLPSCSTGGLPAGNPCMISIVKNNAGDVLLNARAPGGDPTSIVGLPAVDGVTA